MRNEINCLRSELQEFMTAFRCELDAINKAKCQSETTKYNSNDHARSMRKSNFPPIAPIRDQQIEPVDGESGRDTLFEPGGIPAGNVFDAVRSKKGTLDDDRSTFPSPKTEASATLAYTDDTLDDSSERRLLELKERLGQMVRDDT